MTPKNYFDACKNSFYALKLSLIHLVHSIFISVGGGG